MSDEGFGQEAKTVDGWNKKSVGVGVCVLIEKDGRVALIKRKGAHGAGTWATPGGHIDFGETIVGAAGREVDEEVGLKIAGLLIMGLTEDFFESEDRHYLTIWFQAKWISGELPESGEEFSQSGWFDFRDLPEPLFLPLQNLKEGKMIQSL